MKVVFNDYSLDGQFQSTEDFTEYAERVLLDILQVMQDCEIPLLSSYDTYSRMVTNEMSLNDLLYMSSNNPVITSLKLSIIKLAYEPYWDDDVKTCKDTVYGYPIQNVAEPNCFTEAIARKNAMLSVPELSEFDQLFFECIEDKNRIRITNIKNKNELLDTYLYETKDIVYVINNYGFAIDAELVKVDGKCFAEESLLDTGIKEEDCWKIVEAIKWVADGIMNNQSSHYSKHVSEDIYELRVDLSSSKTYRLFFVIKEGIKFLNGFIKKTQKTPKSEIDRAKSIRKQCGDRLGW